MTLVTKFVHFSTTWARSRQAATSECAYESEHDVSVQTAASNEANPPRNEQKVADDDDDEVDKSTATIQTSITRRGRAHPPDCERDAIKMQILTNANPPPPPPPHPFFNRSLFAALSFSISSFSCL